MKNELFKGCFRARNLPINADYRPMYKVGIIILILNIACRGGKSSLNKLHFLVWSLKSRRNMAFIRLALIRQDFSKIITWGVEPALNKALNIAVGENLITLQEDKYKLTEKGMDLSNKIKKDLEIFIEEKSFLNYIGKQKITEEYIIQLSEPRPY